jgi:hypothetical protein
VVLVIEDLHTVSGLAECIDFVDSFVADHFGDAPELRIIVTSRDAPGSGLEMRAACITPQVITPELALEFFISLCRANGLEPDLGDTAADRAFTHLAMRTTLFVMIAAFVAVSQGDPKAVPKILSLQRSEVLVRLIRHLIIQASFSDDLQVIFPRLYGDFAMAVWPKAMRMTVEEVEVFQQIAARYNVPETEQPDAGTLVRDGFLYSTVPEALYPNYAFPHPAISDYLVAQALLRASDFTLLAKDARDSRIDGPLGFIHEALQQLGTPDEMHSILHSLAVQAFGAFARLLAMEPPLLAGMGWQSFILSHVATASWWAGDAAPADIPFARWREWAQVLSAAQDGDADDFLVRLQAVATHRAIIAITALQSPGADMTLDRWLAAMGIDDKDPYRVAFQAAADAEPEVANYLVNHLSRGDSDLQPARWNSFQIGWNSRNPSLHKAARAYLLRVGKHTSHSHHARLIRMPGAVRVLAESCRELEDDPRRREIGLSIGRLTGAVLVAPGTYRIRRNGEPDSHTIKTPLLVPREARSIEGAFSPSRASQAVQRQCDLNALLGGDEMLVVLQHFSGPGGGASYSIEIPEAYRTAGGAPGVALPVITASGQAIGRPDTNAETPSVGAVPPHFPAVNFREVQVPL